MTNKRVLLFLACTSASALFAQTGTGPCTASQVGYSEAASEINNRACASETFIAGSGGVTINTLVITDGSNPAKIVAATGSGAYGVAQATVAAAASVQVQRYGQALCVLDNTGTAGDLVVAGTSTVIDCRDSGQTSASNIALGTHIIGVLLTSASGGATATVALTPEKVGTQVSSSGAYAASRGPTATITETGSDVTVFSVSGVPALAAGSCYFIDYASGASTAESNQTLKIDGTAVALIMNGTGGAAFFRNAFSYCNTVGSQTVQGIMPMFTAYGSANVWVINANGLGMPTTPTAVNWATSHTVSITSNATNGQTIVGSFFHIYQ